MTLKEWTPLGGGLYRHNKSGGLYHRPVINGRRTFRALKTKHEKTARQLIAQNQIASDKARAGGGPDPYARAAATMTGEVIGRYLADGCPDRHRCPRPPLALQSEQAHCATLLQHWRHIPVQDATLAELDRYYDWRIQQFDRRPSPGHGRARACAGDNAVDQELGTLSNAFNWACRCELIRFNPMAGRRPKYHLAKNIRHCREYTPDNAEQLHEVARWIFLRDGRSETLHRSEVLGWQYLLEAFTGMRAAESTSLRSDARPGQAGHIAIDPRTGEWKHLHVRRAKGGLNPYIILDADKTLLLQTLFQWRALKHPGSPWYLPSPQEGRNECVSIRGLAQALRGASRHFGRKFTAHATRAYYVTVRRSWGINDAQIAIEIGHRGGPGLLTTTYGGVPTNWLTGDGPKMTWMPLNAPPAWDVLNLPLHSNVVQLPNVRIA